MNSPSNEVFFATSWTLKVADRINFHEQVQGYFRREECERRPAWPGPQEFEARVRVVAALILDVTPRLAEPGKLTLAEDGTRLLVQLDAELPFLDAVAREDVAFELVFLYGSQSWLSSDEEKAMAQELGYENLKQMMHEASEAESSVHKKEQQEKDMEQERSPPGMGLKEITEIVDDAREIEYLDRQAEQRAWKEEQRAKAGGIVELVRQHLPAEALQEVRELLCTRYGCTCLCDVLEGRPPGSSYEFMW